MARSLAFGGPFWYSAGAMDQGVTRQQSGLKGVLYLLSFAILTAAAILMLVRLHDIEGPLSDNILIIILNLANFLLLAAVIFMTARSLWKLSVERRSGVLGARFRTKLVFAFVSLSFIPTILLFIIGSGIFTRSIERLFILRVEDSLRDSVAVAQAYYDRLSAQGLVFGRQISRQITDERLLVRFDRPVLRDYVGKKAGEYGIGAVEVFGEGGQRLLAVTTDQFPARTFTPAPADLVKKALSAEDATAVTDLGRQGEIVRSVVPLAAPEAGEPLAGAVAVSYYVSESLSAKAGMIRAGYAEYRSSLQRKDPLKFSVRMGFLAVTLTLLLAAVWVALRVSAGITVPIRKLAEGTKEIAAGNLDYRIDDQSGDEVGMLVESFNTMTEDLRDSRVQLEQEMVHRETILSNIDTGVVSIDRFGRIKTVNPAAEDILGIRSGEIAGRIYSDAFSFIELDPVRSLFRRLEQGKGRAEEVISLTVRGRTLTLRVRVSTLREGAGGTMSVITFQNLTELLRAQKAMTWQDVARKIAHEVKNPLTPIKLSAERLRKKFNEGAPDLAAVFDEASRTIIHEVDGLKRLLDEFSEFARMPRSIPSRRPLAPVVDEVAQLYAAHRDVVIARDLPADLPDVLIDAEQMKRVFINLFTNAVDVMNGAGTITVSARLNGEGLVRVIVADDGPGIAAEDLPHVFEPYFSRKSKGSGLGLAIVERIIADHNGTIHAEQNQPGGARFVIVLPVAEGKVHSA